MLIQDTHNKALVRTFTTWRSVHAAQLGRYAPTMPLKKPQTGRYHLIRFIRGDGKLDVFGEKFKMPLELHYEYVVATVDLEQQRLMIFHDQNQLLDLGYKLS